jgi:uncharacterized protein (DUF1778 family)
MAQKSEKRSDARAAGVLVRMSPLEHRLLRLAARESDTTVNDFVLSVLRPIFIAQLQQEQLDLGIPDQNLVGANN